MSQKNQLIITPLTGYAGDIGRWLWMMEATRRRTLAAIKDTSPEVIDWTPPHGGNAIGTLLYHIAVIEMDWLFVEVLERSEFPDNIKALFPYDVRDDQGKLSKVAGVSLEEHVHRLDAMRAVFLDAFRVITIDDVRRPRSLEQYDVTPEWVIFHLVRHEAEHQGQIMLLRSMAENDRMQQHG